MNLLDDLVEMKADGLRKDGVYFDENFMKSDPRSFLADCYEFEGRRIPNRSRKVSFSKELTSSLSGSSHEQAVDNLRSIAESGRDLCPYQTGRLGRFDKADKLLSDWGIHHLHLGPPPEGTTLSGRTGELLFAVFTLTDAYFLMVGDHFSFEDVVLLEIIDGNWPQLIDPFVPDFDLDLVPVPTPSDIKALRGANFLGLIRLSNGRVLFPMGGGLTSAGTSASCMRQALQIVSLLRKVEEFVCSREEQIRSALGIGPEIRIRLADEPQYGGVCIFGDGNPNRLVRIPVKSAL